MNKNRSLDCRLLTTRRIITLVQFTLLLRIPLLAAAPSAIPEDIKTSIRQRVDRGYCPAVMLAVSTPDGREYFSYGHIILPDGPPPESNTVFEIGSVTKVFTTLLLADMTHRGEVNLDDPIQKYLPPSITAPTRKGQSITLAQLATHTSALPRLPNNMTSSGFDNPYADYSVERMFEFLSRCPLTRDVGSKYEYSNLGIGLLGCLLARAADKTYEQLIAERITIPLALADTAMTLNAPMKQRLAQGYRDHDPATLWDFQVLAGTGAIRSTADDLLTFLEVQMAAKSTPLQPAIDLSQQPRSIADTPDVHLGLGWYILTIENRSIYLHDGGTGGFFCFVAFEKAARRAAVVWTNSMISVDDLALRLFLPQFPLNEFPQRTSSESEIPLLLLPGETLPTGAAVMERYLDAIGGRPALARLNRRTVRAAIEMKIFGTSVPGTILCYQARPQQYYIKTQIPGLYTAEQGCDGQTVWELDSVDGPRILSGEEKATMLLSIPFDETDYNNRYERISCVAKVSLGGQSCYKLILTPRAGLDPITRYFAVDSALPLRTVCTLPEQNQKTTVVVQESDFRPVDGIRYPHRSQETAEGVTTITTVNHIDHDPNLPPDCFNLPDPICNLLPSSTPRQIQ